MRRGAEPRIVNVDASVADNILTASLSAVTGALVSYFVAKYQMRAKFRGNVDTALIRKREQLYLSLWKLTAVIPRWPRAHDCTYEDIGQLGLAMRDWYFQGGGLYLSEQARAAYGVLRDRMDAFPPRIGVVNDADYDHVFDAASKLRTELTKDLFSRERAQALGASYK